VVNIKPLSLYARETTPLSFG